MNRPMTPARRHFERATAAQREAEAAPIARADATAYELMLAKLAEDKRSLKALQSVERKIEVKRTLLPEYLPWVDGVLAGGHGVQDDVLMTILVWAIDVGEADLALRIGEHAIRHKLVMPDQYQRTTGCLIAEEFADQALKALAADTPADQATAIAGVLVRARSLTAGEDMPDEVRAKLCKAIGYAQRAAGALPDALESLKQALALHGKSGVKRDIEIIERELKKNAAPGGAGTGNGNGAGKG